MNADHFGKAPNLYLVPQKTLYDLFSGSNLWTSFTPGAISSEAVAVFLLCNEHLLLGDASGAQMFQYAQTN